MATIAELLEAANRKVQRGEETKALLKTRLTEKGLDVASENNFYNLADKVGEIEPIQYFFLRIGGGDAVLQASDFLINSMFITQANYDLSEGNIGDPIKIPILPTPNTYNGVQYNAYIALHGSYMITLGRSIIEDKRSASSTTSCDFYYFNAVPNKEYKFSITYD